MSNRILLTTYKHLKGLTRLHTCGYLTVDTYHKTYEFLDNSKWKLTHFIIDNNNSNNNNKHINSLKISSYSIKELVEQAKQVNANAIVGINYLPKELIKNSRVICGIAVKYDNKDLDNYFYFRDKKQ